MNFINIMLGNGLLAGFIKLMIQPFMPLYAVQTTAGTTDEPSATGILKRTVSDEIRALWPGVSQLMALISRGQVRNGKFSTGPGLIRKKSSDHLRFENFTYTPLAITVTANGALSGTTLTLDSSTGLTEFLTLINTANGSIARIDSITSTTVVEITTIGDTAFSVADNDVLLVGAPAYPENSSNPAILQKTEDNIYNLLQTVRFPVAISGSAKDSTDYAGNFWERIKKRSLTEGMRKSENTFIHGERAAGTGNKTAGGSAQGDSFHSTRGYRNWAANAFDAGGSMTLERFQDDLVQNMGDAIDNASPYIMLHGKQIGARIMQWIRDKQVIEMDGGVLEKFGIKAKKIMTSGPTIELVQHDAYDRGSFSNAALIMNPDEMFYCYKKGRDLNIRKNIQSPSTDGMEDEIFGDIGAGVTDGGQTITEITNWFNN